MKKIKLTNHHLPAIVDDDVFDAVRAYNWQVKLKKSVPAHVYRYQRLGPKKYKVVRLHVHIFGKAPDGLVWDHKNGDVFDNQGHNLRAITQRRNMQNMRVRKTTDRLRSKRSRYKGVSLQQLIHGRWVSNKPWRARIRVNGKLLSLGFYANEADAAKAYNSAAELHFGEFAALNEVAK